MIVYVFRIDSFLRSVREGGTLAKVASIGYSIFTDLYDNCGWN